MHNATRGCTVNCSNAIISIRSDLIVVCVFCILCYGCCLGFAYAECYGIRLIRAQNASVIGLLESLGAVVLSFLILNETMSVTTLLGGGFILLAALLASWEKPVGWCMSDDVKDGGRDGGVGFYLKCLQIIYKRLWKERVIGVIVKYNVIHTICNRKLSGKYYTGPVSFVRGIP